MSTYSPTRNAPAAARKSRSRPLSWDSPGFGAADAPASDAAAIVRGSSSRRAETEPDTEGAPVEDQHASKFEPRRVLSLHQAKRRSRLTLRMRRAFAFVMGTIVFTVVALGVMNSLRVDRAFAISGPAAGESVRMINPRFTGRDAHGAPYVIVADAAIRRQSDPARMVLEKPELSVTTDGGVSLLVTAHQGVYDRSREILDLSGLVRLSSNGGYVFETEEARIYVNAGIAEGQTPVTGVGPMGSIVAGAFTIFQDQRKLVFRAGDSDGDLVHGKILRAGASDDLGLRAGDAGAIGGGRREDPAR